MYGSNQLGQGYYGQGPAVGSSFTLHTVTAVVVAVASISFKLLINYAVSASVTTVATISRLFTKTLSASVSFVATISSMLVEGINIRQATTKLLNLFRTTNPVGGFDNSAKQLNIKRTTRIITTDE